MSRYHWPGNVRELEHVVERPVLLTKDAHIDLQALPPEVRGSVERKGAGPRHLPMLMTLEQIERRALLEALERSNWNKQLAAASLGIYRPTLYGKMRKYAVRGPDRAAAGAR
jgi:transcriptional regulator of acetoin/glycerol metabolism